MPKVTEHPLVKVRKLRGHLRVEWTDPDGKRRSCWLDTGPGGFGGLGYGSYQQAMPWLKRKSRELVAARSQDASGEGMALRDLWAAYLKHRANETGRELTVQNLAARFWEWCDVQEVTDLRQLTEGSLGEFREWLGATGIRHASRNRIMGAVKPMLHHAMDLHRTNLSRDQVRRALRPFRVERSEPEVASTEELREFLRAAATQDGLRCFSGRKNKRAYSRKKPDPNAARRFSPVLPWFVILLLTGLRRGELVNLRWKDVDLSRKVLTVAPAKTAAGRRVGFADSPALVRVLTSLRAKRNPKNPKVYPYATWVRKGWERVESGLKIQLGPQTLRRTHATVRAMAGMAPYVLAKHMGHSVQVSGRYYVAAAARPEGNTLEEWLGVADLLAEAYPVTLGSA